MTDTPHTHDIAELTLADLCAGGRYVVPIYQRNYAWGQHEVEQLMQDILDVTLRGDQQNYHIGSLVTYVRTDGAFEIIDGQQRLTTLSIVLAALRHAHADIHATPIREIDLRFDSRPKSDTTLRQLFAGHADDPGLDASMRAAYGIARRFLKNETRNIAQLTRYLLGNVKILRTAVPPDTDLNHYFEIMNNRGEQLEKHEVLKAKLMGALASDAERAAFASVWDACADMQRYVQMSFGPDARKRIFGEGWNACPADFDQLTRVLGTSAGAETQSLKSLIESRTLSRTPVDVTESGNERFGSVIGFSNFLLHVLRVLLERDIPLDDKQLLEAFDASPVDPRRFIVALLKCRMLFDRYVIKRERDEDWSLQTVRVYASSSDYVNSFEDESLNRQLIMLLSMFHVSFPAQVYKHWLNAALLHLYGNADGDMRIDGARYLAFLETLGDRFMFGHFAAPDGGKKDYFGMIYGRAKVGAEFNKDALNAGTDIPNFIFNRLDYLIWKGWRDRSLPNSILASAYFDSRAKAFRFTFRTSVEHHYPRNPVSKEKLTKSLTLPHGVDTFGNLCLIQHGSNSRLGNLLPNAKKEYYAKAGTTESLKQTLMMALYDNWGPDRPDDIARHEGQMIAILLRQSVPG
ncbi:DUF262 domain-containing protein [Burkholderia multivorans]